MFTSRPCQTRRRLQWSRPNPGPLVYQDLSGESLVFHFLALCKDILPHIVNTYHKFDKYFYISNSFLFPRLELLLVSAVYFSESVVTEGLPAVDVNLPENFVGKLIDRKASGECDSCNPLLTPLLTHSCRFPSPANFPGPNVQFDFTLFFLFCFCFVGLGEGGYVSYYHS